MTALLTADEAARLRPGEQLAIVRSGDTMVRTDRTLWPGSNLPDVDVVAPKAWAALIGPCPDPLHDNTRKDGGWARCGRPDCRDGRRIVPLYTERPWPYPHTRRGIYHSLVGRAAVVSIEPEDDGRNFRIALDVVEVV